MLIGTEAKRYDRVTVRILPFKDTGGGRTRTNGIFLLLTLLTFLLVLASFESVTFSVLPCRTPSVSYRIHTVGITVTVHCAEYRRVRTKRDNRTVLHSEEVRDRDPRRWPASWGGP